MPAFENIQPILGHYIEKSTINSADEKYTVKKSAATVNNNGVFQTNHVYTMKTAKSGLVGSIDLTTLFDEARTQPPTSSNITFNDYWNPTYSTSINPEQNVEDFTLGEGYKQIFNNRGLIFDKNSYNILFENISNLETKSLLIFFELSQGTRNFLFKIEGITTPRRVICKNWSHTFNSYNVNTISATFGDSTKRNTV